MLNPYAKLVATTFSDRLFAAIGEAAESDAGVREVLEELQNRKILFEFIDLNQELGLIVVDAVVSECEVSDEEADLLIRGSLIAVVKAVFSDNRNPARIEGVELYGDMKLAQRLFQIIDRVEFDWEEVLAKKTGDVPARHIGNLLRWGNRSLIGEDSTLATKIRTALIDQKQLLPRRIRVEKFLDDVDTLQADLDRLEKRTDRLERRSER